MMFPFEADVSLKTFTGKAPVFPLPSGILLPHLMQPLHIFEERYRDMTADALAGDGFLSLALLQPGWESNYESKTVPIYPVVCLGRITADEQLEDGRYNIIVQGLCRARVHDEADTSNRYRVGHLEPLEDRYEDPSADDWDEYQRRLVAAFRVRFPQLAGNVDLQRAVREDLSIGVLADLLASSLSLDPQDSATILKETDVRRRCQWILDRLGPLRETDPDNDFPPAFSRN